MTPQVFLPPHMGHVEFYYSSNLDGMQKISYKMFTLTSFKLSLNKHKRGKEKLSP